MQNRHIILLYLIQRLHYCCTASTTSIHIRGRLTPANCKGKASVGRSRQSLIWNYLIRKDNTDSKIKLISLGVLCRTLSTQIAMKSQNGT